MVQEQKIEEAVLALLGVFQFDTGRAWKRYDFAVMDSLHAQGFITNPRGKTESVLLTPKGQARASRAGSRTLWRLSIRALHWAV